MNAIKSALYNLSLSENDNRNITALQREYYKGLIVGIISTLMQEREIDFQLAYSFICKELPRDCIDLNTILPNNWR